MPEENMAFHWHGETHALPPGATLRAHSQACEVQAFETAAAHGLQVHLEMTCPDLDDLIRNCGHEIGTGPYEQSPEVLRAGESIHGASARQMLYRLLDTSPAKVISARRGSHFAVKAAPKQHTAVATTFWFLT